MAVSLGADGSLAVEMMEFSVPVFRNRCSEYSRMRRFHDRRLCPWFVQGTPVRGDPASCKRNLRAAAMREETGFFVMEDMEKLLPQIEITRL